MESKYKIGDRVRVKSLDWYNANKGKFDNIVLGGVRPSFTHYMSRYCGQVMTIVAIDSEYGDYTMKEDNGDYGLDFNIIAPIPKNCENDYTFRIDNWGNKWDGTHAYVQFYDYEIYID